MNFLAPLVFFPVIPIALFVAWLLNRIFRINPPEVKYKTIDGLRGYLALFVFLHHSMVWHTYLQTGRWDAPASNLYNNFGQASVSLFFMITGFLFFTKMRDNAGKDFSWLKLFVSRFMRLTPLYLFSFFIILFIVGVITQFQLREPLGIVLVECWKWMTFNLFGESCLNTTNLPINAGVTWSLVYEWFFYFSLPLFGAIFFRIKSGALTSIIVIVLLIVIASCTPLNLALFYSFVGGIIAAWLIRSEKIRKLAVSPWAALIAMASVVATVKFFRSPVDYIPAILLSIAFIIIACGNTLFGVLKWKISRLFGQLSYPIYLLHGIVLFVMIHFIAGEDKTAKLSFRNYWLFIYGCAAIVVTVCFVMHHLVELPGMKRTGKVYDYIRSLFDTSRVKVKTVLLRITFRR
jgi:peptidoglycan/LPS O-acetylase OafA/YrhL